MLCPSCNSTILQVIAMANQVAHNIITKFFFFSRTFFTLFSFQMPYLNRKTMITGELEIKSLTILILKNSINDGI